MTRNIDYSIFSKKCSFLRVKKRETWLTFCSKTPNFWAKMLTLG